VTYVRCDDGLVHGLSPFAPNVTGCGLGFVSEYQLTDDAPTCLRCISAEGTWRQILVRAIERRKRSL
jgi:hypothetical protein